MNRSYSVPGENKAFNCIGLTLVLVSDILYAKKINVDLPCRRIYLGVSFLQQVTGINSGING